MRAVVLGATGNIGTAVTEHLAGDPNVTSVIGVARRTPTRPTSSFPGAQKVAWMSADIRSDSLETVLDGADTVVHLAWMFQPTHRPEITWQTNVIGTSRLLEAVRNTGVTTLAIASSIAAYSPRTGTTPVDETWPTHGASSAAYAREKAYVERLLDAFESRSASRVVRVRPAFVFQRRSASEQRRIFAGPLVPGWLVRPSLVPALPAPAGLRLQAVHASDVADAFARAVRSEQDGAFNVCADDVLEPRDLARLFDAPHVRVRAGLLRGVMNAAWTARALPADPRLFDAVMMLPIMSNGRAKSELGWRPSRSARHVLEEFLVALRHGAGHPTPPLKPDAR